MSINIVKNHIFHFLSSDAPEVMAIKGDWGVGKTFSWKKFLTEHNRTEGLSLERYSYVSLFGINSLEAFKYAIFENVVKRDMIENEASIETFKSNTNSLIESFGRKSLNFIKHSPTGKGLNHAIDALSFLSVTKTLICIDDLERKGSNLAIKDILGLVSLLKEQKKCKIVILLNDGEEGLEEYDKYREKVIDIELQFNPTAEECAAIAFEDDKSYHARLKELVTKLGIRNIRILKKIERLVDLGIPLAKDFEPEITDQILHSIALHSWCFYCSSTNDNVPNLDFVLKKGYTLFGIGDDKDESEKEKNWKAMLHDYNYQLTDEVDHILADAVKTGYFNDDEFIEKASKKNKEIKAAKSEGSFSNAWDLYHHSFDNNTEEVVNTLYESFKTNCRHISPTNLQGTVSLLRELGEEEKASELIDHYIDNRSDQINLFDLDKSNTFGDIKDAEIVEKFDQKYSTSVTTESAKDVLKRLAGQNGWNQSDEVILANATVDEFYDIFKTESGPHLSSLVTTALKFRQFGNANERMQLIANKASEALQRIGGESEINKRRVKKFGVDV